MSTALKIVLIVLAAFAGLIVYNGMNDPSTNVVSSSQASGASQSAASEATTPPTANLQPPASAPSQSGWANSGDVFRSRWNSMAKDPYKLSPFDATGGASFFQGTVNYSHTGSGEAMYFVETTSKPLIIGSCGMGFAAATGVTGDIGLEVAKAAINNLQVPGYVSLGGHVMTISPDGDSTACLIYEHTGQ